MEPFASTQGYHSYPVDVSLDAFEPKKSQPVPFTFIVPAVSAEASTNSIAGVPFCDAPVTAVAPSVSVPTPEPVVPTVPLPVSMPDMTATTTAANTLVSVPNMTSSTLVADTPVSVPNMSSATPVADTPVSVPNMTGTTPTSVNVFASAPASASVSVPSEPFDRDGETEEKLLRELAEMGFKEVDLNKEILRQNNYNLEQSVDDLCGVNEWDPLLAELEEMVRCLPYSVSMLQASDLVSFSRVLMIPR
jgi:next to BRCA1 gene 1 protein